MSDNTQSVPVERYLSDHFEWAAPGDQQEDAWLVRFCDKERGEAIFTGPDAEREAWDYWNRYAPFYNMYVFRLAALAQSVPVEQALIRAVLAAYAPSLQANPVESILTNQKVKEALAALAQSKGEPVASLAEEWCDYMNEAVSRAPDPVRNLGEFLAGLLDEDHWKTAERYLNAIVLATPQDPAAGERAAEPDLLAEFGKRLGWELSFQGWDEDACWQVHNVTGGRNDREWTLIGEGETPQDAIRAAIETGAHGGRAD